MVVESLEECLLEKVDDGMNEHWDGIYYGWDFIYICNVQAFKF